MSSDAAEQHDGDLPAAEHHHANRSFMVHRHRDVTGGTARAAVFGVSDGLVSNVALILGVAAANAERSNVLVAGVAGLMAGAASMAAGEYVSMKAQAELVERELEIERRSLARQPDMERRELAALYRKRGIGADHADEMADAVMADPEIALEVHAREELGVDPRGIGNPVAAAFSSFVAFAIGALIPLIPWFFGEGDAAIIASSVLGLMAAATVGAVLAHFTERSRLRTIGRQVGWAVVACTATWLIGSWLGATIA
jgi:VIT1/CCC1 family predicted Fe2+/Mn2+ transporter